jgi:hypothetical protein
MRWLSWVEVFWIMMKMVRKTITMKDMGAAYDAVVGLPPY